MPYGLNEAFREEAPAFRHVAGSVIWTWCPTLRVTHEAAAALLNLLADVHDECLRASPPDRIAARKARKLYLDLTDALAEQRKWFGEGIAA